MTYRIDKKKWDAAVAAVIARRAEPGRPGWKRDRDTAELTLLYSIRAHGRGRLHRARVRLTYAEAVVAKDRAWAKHMDASDFAAAGGKLVHELDLEDQARYVGTAWTEYELVAEAAA